MTDVRLVIWLDGDDFAFIQRAYKAMHLTASQVVQIALDRFLAEPSYRSRHPFTSPQSLGRDDEDDDHPGRVINGRKISIRVDGGNRDQLKAMLSNTRLTVAGFVRGAIMFPGTVLGSEYLTDRFGDYVYVDEGFVVNWVDAPVGNSK